MRQGIIEELQKIKRRSNTGGSFAHKYSRLNEVLISSKIWQVEMKLNRMIKCQVVLCVCLPSHQGWPL